MLNKVAVLTNVKVHVYYIKPGFETKSICIFYIILRFLSHMKLLIQFHKYNLFTESVVEKTSGFEIEVDHCMLYS